MGAMLRDTATPGPGETPLMARISEVSEVREVRRIMESFRWQILN